MKPEKLRSCKCGRGVLSIEENIRIKNGNKYCPQCGDEVRFVEPELFIHVSYEGQWYNTEHGISIETLKKLIEDKP